MRKRGAEWKRVLLDASAQAMRATERLRSAESRKKVVGTGASGDETLLADKKAEEALIASLSRVEGLRILSEEAGEVGDRRADLLAVLDPLDGSSNFKRGIPFYCTSIAIVKGERLEDVRFALVRNLVTGEVYFAEKGKGATKDGRRIGTSATKKVAEAVVGVDISRTTGGTIARLTPLITTARRQVHYGANALELCFVAEGRTDAFVDVRNRMRVVDFAGAYLIAKEAGATVTSQAGSDVDPDLDMKSRFSFVASANTTLHGAILDLLSGRV